jgi:hypothetical protein
MIALDQFEDALVSTVLARMPNVARRALSGMTGKISASFHSWPTSDQS